MKEILNMAGNALVAVSGRGETLALKSLALVGLAVLLMALWRRGAAGARHLAWVTVFLCLLCLPGLVRFMPVWHPPAWMASAGFNVNLPGMTSLGTAEPAVRQSATMPVAQSGGEVAVAAKNFSGEATAAKTPVQSVAISWGEILVAIWAGGILDRKSVV